MPKHLAEGGRDQQWDVGLCETCYTIPKYFCAAFFCPCCFAYNQRSELLKGDLEGKYKCCQDAYCDCGESCRSCPQLCLCIEILLCFWCAIAGNRFLLQKSYSIQNTCFEECILWTACIVSWIRPIISIFVDIPVEVDCAIDCLYCALQACMQSQQENEIDKRGVDGVQV
eukprot:TRINITY_DN763_c0_g1_i1.p1 TRINITY_DN763_c0_g1~~TRINITY_DN763_c0_g1_i1.p1  ORF type:complete len:190 (+),score=31.48 TRINITY_DN763_c0_g1_i1:63-572(+)